MALRRLDQSVTGSRFHKVAARVTEMVTRIKVSLPTSFVGQHDFAALAARIATLPS
jgi:hypothetical protein